MKVDSGTIVDRYQVKEHLGQGGMATVYRVLHTSLGTEHALKLLTVHGPEVRGRLLQEGRVQAQLKHPNILSVTDVIVMEDSPGLIMEFVRGPSLEDLLELGAPSREQADVLGRGILAGIGYAHKKGLVHRDLKPANILCEVQEDLSIVPKVADFGLVKALGAEEGAGLGKTRTGQILGTPYYMAPEQVRDSKNVDHRTDLWALGVMLYEMLTGRLPFEGDDVFEVFQKVTKGRYTWPEGAEAHLPKRMVDAVKTCLVVDRDARAASCEDLLRIWEGDGEDYVPLPTEVRWEGVRYQPPPDLDASDPALRGTLDPTAKQRSSFDNSISLPNFGDDGDSWSKGAPPPPKGRRRLALWIGLALGGAVVVAIVAGLVAVLAWTQLAPDTAEPIPPAAEAVIPAPATDPAAVPQHADPDPVPAKEAPEPSATPQPQAAPAPEPLSAPQPAAAAPTPAPAAAPAAEPSALPEELTQGDEPAPEEPEATPEPAPAPVAPTTATWSVEGDVRVVLLRDVDRNFHRPGQVPPGTYTVVLTLQTGPAEAGSVTLAAGDDRTLLCSSKSRTCR
jgi:serine/threonine-protein kinase